MRTGPGSAFAGTTAWIGACACAAAIVALTSCRRLPDEVYVPAAGFRSRIVATTSQGRSATVRAGDWLTLSVSRTSGPWVRVRRATLAPESCWLAPAPGDERGLVREGSGDGRDRGHRDRVSLRRRRGCGTLRGRGSPTAAGAAAGAGRAG